MLSPESRSLQKEPNLQGLREEGRKGCGWDRNSLLGEVCCEHSAIVKLQLISSINKNMKLTRKELQDEPLR